MISVSKRYYKNDHDGKEPRGYGHWAFKIRGKEWWTPEPMMFSEACKLAKKEAQLKCVSIIYVLP